jgi:HSP20 family molecular chaperone IbpA
MMHNMGVARRFTMEPVDERDDFSVYRTKRLRQWQITFHPGEVHSLFDELIHRHWGRARWQPKIDVLRIASGYVVEADIPGVDEDSIDVGIRGNNLTIEGRRSPRLFERRVGVLVCERPEGSFSRVIQFAESIEGYSLRKSMTQGVLTLILTKA